MKRTQLEEMSKDRSATGGAGQSVGALIISLCLVLIVAGLICCITSLMNQKQMVSPDIDPNAGVYNGENFDLPAEPGKMSIAGYSKATIPAHKTEVPLLLRNPDTNMGKVYFSYDLVLDDTGETLYSSRMVPGGQAITHITLNRPLPPGVYKATVIWKSHLEEENFREGNSVNMKLELTVK